MKKTISVKSKTRKTSALKTSNTELTGGYDVLWRTSVYNLGEDLGGRIIIPNPAEKYWLVNKCINHIAEKLVSIPFAYQDTEGNEIEDGELIKIMQQPNPRQDWWDFLLRTVYGWMACNAFCWFKQVEGNRLLNIYSLPPNRIKILTQEDDNGIQYISGYQFRAHSGKLHSIPLDSLIFCARPSIYGDLVGDQILRMGTNVIASQMAAEEMNAHSMLNNAIPPMVIEMPPDVTEKQMDDFSRFLLQNWTGSSKSKVPGLLPAGAKAVPISTSFKEGDFLNLKREDAQNICAMMGVPYNEIFPHAAGLGSGKESEETPKKFYNNTILPIAGRITHAWQMGVINSFLWNVKPTKSLKAKWNIKSYLRSKRDTGLFQAPSVTENIHCYFKTDEIDVFFKERLANAEAAQKSILSGMTSPNDAIRAYDLPFPDDDPNGDVRLVSFNVAPLESIVNADKTEIAESEGINQGKTVHIKSYLSLTDTFTKALSTLQTLTNVAGKQIETEKALIPEKIAVEIDKIDESMKTTRHEHIKQLESVLRRGHNTEVNRCSTHLRTFFAKQRFDTLKRLHAVGEDALLSHRGTKATMQMDWYVIPASEDARLIDIMKPAYRNSMRAGAQVISDHKGTAIEVENKVIDEYITKRAAILPSVNETTTKNLENVWQDWLAGDKPVDELAGAVQTYFQKMQIIDFDKAGVHSAGGIGLAEAGGGFNAGVIHASNIAGAQRKAWLSSRDGKVREAHIKADNEYSSDGVPMNEKFIVGGEALEFPRDPSGSAENICNCRCLAVPLDF